MKFYYFAFFFLFILVSKAQYVDAKHKMMWSYKYTNYKKALKKPSRVKLVAFEEYKDSVFPNNDVMQFKSAEGFFIRGVNKINVTGDSSYLPTIRIDTLKLKELTNLKYLSIINFDLTIFPEGIYTARQLKGLALSMCKIKFISSQISKLSQLSYLEMRINEIKEIPATLLDLKQLECLDLCNNKITTFPDFLKDFTMLRVLNFGNMEGYESKPPSFKYPINLYVNKIDYLKDYDTIKQVLLSQKFQKLYGNICNEISFAQKLEKDQLTKKVKMLRCIGY